MHDHEHESGQKRADRREARPVVERSAESERLTPWALAEPELTHRQLAMAFHAAPIGMAVTTDDGVLVQANPALGALLGLRPELLLGRRLEDFTVKATPTRRR